MMRKEVDMKKYNNWGIDMGGLSATDPVRYRKINHVLNDKGVHTDLLDTVETVSLDHVYDLADDGPSPEDVVFENELKVVARRVLSSLTPREERVLRRRFGIGVPDATLAEVSDEFGLARCERVRQIEAKALRKLKHPSRSRKCLPFIEEIAA